METDLEPPAPAVTLDNHSVNNYAEFKPQHVNIIAIINQGVVIRFLLQTILLLEDLVHV